MIEIPLSKKGKHAGKYVAIVDDIDADLAELNWSVILSSNSNYAQRAIRLAPLEKQICQKIHRVILERILGRGLLRTEFVDHINRDGLDNRRENLRLATHQQNIFNSKRMRNSSGYKGVFRSAPKWCSRIKLGGKSIYLGYFDTPEEAHEAYKKAVAEYHGEFARFD